MNGVVEIGSLRKKISHSMHEGLRVEGMLVPLVSESE